MKYCSILHRPCYRNDKKASAIAQTLFQNEEAKVLYPDLSGPTPSLVLGFTGHIYCVPVCKSAAQLF